MSNKLLLCLATGLILTSCGAAHHPKMISFTPAIVVIDYSQNDLHEATNLAQQFCSSINKDAQYVRTDKNDGFLSSVSYGVLSKERHAFFNCIESSNKNNRSNSNEYSNSHMPIINNFKLGSI